MITQKKLAQHLGMAPRTVSNILSGRLNYRYSEATRQRVFAAAEEMGYRSNRLARAVRRGRSNLLGTINFGSLSELGSKIHTRLPQLITEEGYDHLSVDLNWYGGDISRVIDEMIHSRVEGVVITQMAQAFGPQYIEMLSKAGIPAVTLYGSEELGVPLIADDACAVYADMTRHLLHLGHRRILLLIGNSGARPDGLRARGFCQVMQDAGGVQAFEESEFFESSSLPWSTEGSGIILRVDKLRHGHDFAQTTYRAAHHFLKMPEPPEAVICFNDHGAFGVFTAAFELGLRVPEHLAITGCDNDSFGVFPLYGLTTIEKDLSSACSAAIETLTALVRKESAHTSSRFFPSSLVVRTSCGYSISTDSPSHNQSVPVL